jgi:hypothetical protein
MERFQDFARNTTTGAPASAAAITVKNAGTATLSTIYSDDGVTPKANPFTAAVTTGYFTFYAADGLYDITVTPAGVVPPPAYTLSGVLLLTGTGGTVLAADPSSPSDNTWWVVTEAGPPVTASVRIRLSGVTYTLASVTVS